MRKERSIWKEIEEDFNYLSNAGALRRISKEKSYLLMVERHAARVRVPINDHLGMLAAKGFGDVAVPTNGTVRLKNFMKIFGRNLVPKESLPFAVPQRGRVIMPMDSCKRLVAVCAFLGLIPLIDDRPYQTGLWVILDLLQACLPATLLFRPTRACTQPELLGPDDCFVSRVSSSNAYSGVTLVLRAGDYSFAAELQIRSETSTELDNHKNSHEG